MYIGMSHAFCRDCCHVGTGKIMCVLMTFFSRKSCYQERTKSNPPSPQHFFTTLYTHTKPHPFMLTWVSRRQFSASAVKSSSSTSFIPASRKTLSRGQHAAISVITSTEN